MMSEAEAPYRAPRMSDYGSARDLFEAAREAARDADRIARNLDRMSAREGVRAQSYEVRGRSGHRPDATSATDARMDYEGRVRLRQMADYGLIDLACSVLYGRDQLTGGLSALMGPAYADCLWWRFCAGGTWPEVAEGCQMSERWCRGAVELSFDAIDAYGPARVADGLGLAEV